MYHARATWGQIGDRQMGCKQTDSETGAQCVHNNTEGFQPYQESPDIVWGGCTNSLCQYSKKRKRVRGKPRLRWTNIRQQKENNHHLQPRKSVRNYMQESYVMIVKNGNKISSGRVVVVIQVHIVQVYNICERNFIYSYKHR